MIRATIPRRLNAPAAVLAAVLGLGAAPALAHPDHLDVGPEWEGTLAELFALFAPGPAMAQGFEGPTEPVGLSFETLANPDLTGELPGLEGRKLRARLWTLEPGGVVPVHSHANRPAYIYVLEGTVTEHRSDSDTPKSYGPGDLSVEEDGVVHWWENAGDIPVRMLGLDLHAN
ncbi:MAG: cupin domain-containing protein [Pseudomonadota bacterium]